MGQIRVMQDVQGPDFVVQQATVNMLADMFVQPALLAGHLHRAQASSDKRGPWCEITGLVTPWESASESWVISGRAGDVAGNHGPEGAEAPGGPPPAGTVAAVEVSLDGGSRWHPADALEEHDKDAGLWKFVCGNEAWHSLYDDMCGEAWKTKAISARAKLMLLTQILCRAVDDSLNVGAVASAAAAADSGALSQKPSKEL